MEMQEQELKDLYIYDNLAVLKKIEILLNENNIQFLNRSFEDGAYDGLFTLAMGKGKLLVFEKDLEKAKELLKGEKILCGNL